MDECDARGRWVDEGKGVEDAPLKVKIPVSLPEADPGVVYRARAGDEEVDWGQGGDGDGAGVG